ncbi:hypothetical protein [Mucilaginibacter sp. BT774]|uniref:hypothetical protein n=1 Tax=Mucilaginibacter sp. BT774 TaxID=3062276 RepID=UPI002675193E|nr:hypothetical protein [Mucilaginibacter sp. BT774]MDO3625691.1 hypothetical protein [Mucilaginibacter sp. BT774]
MSSEAAYSRKYLLKKGYDVLVEMEMKPGALEAIEENAVYHRTIEAAKGWASRGKFMWKYEDPAWNLGTQQNVDMFNPWIKSVKIIP